MVNTGSINTQYTKTTRLKRKEQLQKCKTEKAEREERGMSITKYGIYQLTVCIKRHDTSIGQRYIGKFRRTLDHESEIGKTYSNIGSKKRGDLLYIDEIVVRKI